MSDQPASTTPPPFDSGLPGPSQLSKVAFRLIRSFAREREAWKKERDELLREIEKTRRFEQGRCAEVASEAFYFRRCLDGLRSSLEQAALPAELNRLEMLERRLVRALGRAKVEVEDLNGREIDDALSEQIEVESAVPADVATIEVYETLDPLVSIDGQVVRIAKVISAVPAQPEP